MKKYFIIYEEANGINLEDSTFIQTSLTEKEKIEEAFESNLSKKVSISDIVNVDNSPLGLTYAVNL